MSTNPNRGAPPRRVPFPLWLVVAAAVVLGIGVWGSYAMRGTGSPTSSGAVQTTSTTAAAGSPGSPGGKLVKLVVRVDRVVSGTTLAGHVAIQNAQGVYTPTAQQVEIDHQLDAVAMGSAQDLKPGALLEISGTSTQDGSGTMVVDASQIVNLTGFVASG